MKQTIYASGKYRILEVEDYVSFDLSCLKGDQFDPKCNPDIDPDKLKQEEDLFDSIVEREGVFGYVLERECKSCGNWEHVDSCFGFVGRYSEKNNHYIVDEMINQIREGN